MQEEEKKFSSSHCLSGHEFYIYMKPQGISEAFLRKAWPQRSCEEGFPERKLFRFDRRFLPARSYAVPVIHAESPGPLYARRPSREGKGPA